MQKITAIKNVFYVKRQPAEVFPENKNKIK